MICFSSATPSVWERWKAFRPQMLPKEPPWWSPRISSSSSSVPLVAPPEKIRMRRGLLRLGLLDMRRGGLYLDDVRAELAGDVSSVRRNVDARLAVLADTGSARIGPYDHGEPLRLGLERQLPEILVHAIPELRAGVDRKAYGDAAEAKRVVDRAGDRRAGLDLRQRVAVVELEDERDLPRVVRGTGLHEAEGRRVGVAPGVDGELKMIERIVSGRVHGERPNRAMLEPLVDRKYDELSRSGERPRIQQADQLRSRTRGLGPIPGQDLLDSIREAHGVISAAFHGRVVWRFRGSKARA